MDVNTIRVAVTVSSLVLFLALVLHTWSRARKAEHEAYAVYPGGSEVLLGIILEDQYDKEERREL